MTTTVARNINHCSCILKSEFGKSLVVLFLDKTNETLDLSIILKDQVL